MKTLSSTTTAHTAAWHIRAGRVIDLDRPRIMGILNVTPDSFSDGGAFISREAAVDRAMTMIDEGAAIIDIGGESTRPGAAHVEPQEQIARILPILREVRKHTDTPISVDTTCSTVAEAAIAAGADIVNDVSAGTDDPAMFRLAAARGCGMIIMHRLAPPKAEQFSDRYAAPPKYADVVHDVSAYLAARRNVAIAAGVQAGALVLDPGLGFGKSVEQNFGLLRRMDALGAGLGGTARILCAASRKSFIGRVSGVEEPARRVMGSVAAAVVAALQGVRLFRVHDVAAHREALAVAAVLAGTPD